MTFDLLYIGEYKNNARNGHGTLVHGKLIKEGVWKNDELRDGKITYEDGRVVEGKFINDVLQK